MRKFLALTLLMIDVAGCDTTDLITDRIPRMPVYLPFTTQSDWHEYGIGGDYGMGGAMQSRIFIRSEKIPAKYPYPDYSYTGFGGLLLTCDVNSELHVFDLACPVERRADVRVAITEEFTARCPVCGSQYDVFGTETKPGAAISGPAVTLGKKVYGLRPYRVVFGTDGRYALLTN